MTKTTLVDHWRKEKSVSEISKLEPSSGFIFWHRAIGDRGESFSSGTGEADRDE